MEKDMRFDKRNVRNLYRSRSLKTVVRELARYNFDVVGIKAVR